MNRTNWFDKEADERTKAALVERHNRFAEEHALIVVDNVTDIATPFNLDKEGSKVVVKKQEGEIIVEETPARF